MNKISVQQFMEENQSICGNSTVIEDDGFLRLPEDIREEVYKIRLPEFEDHWLNHFMEGLDLC